MKRSMLVWSFERRIHGCGRIVCAQDGDGATNWRPRVTERGNGSSSGKLVTLCEPQGIGELALIKSLLDGNGIAYAVHDEHIGALYPGVPLLCGRVMVEEREKARAETLLSRLALQVREATGEEG